MATLSEVWNLRYTSTSLRNRTAAAIAQASQYILIEAPEYPNHTQRLSWAKRALTDANAEAERFMWAVCGNATIQASGDAATDNDIQYVVDSNIDAFAGA